MIESIANEKLKVEMKLNIERDWNCNGFGVDIHEWVNINSKGSKKNVKLMKMGSIKLIAMMIANEMDLVDKEGGIK